MTTIQGLDCKDNSGAAVRTNQLRTCRVTDIEKAKSRCVTQDSGDMKHNATVFNRTKLKSCEKEGEEEGDESGGHNEELHNQTRHEFQVSQQSANWQH